MLLAAKVPRARHARTYAARPFSPVAALNPAFGAIHTLFRVSNATFFFFFLVLQPVLLLSSPAKPRPVPLCCRLTGWHLFPWRKFLAMPWTACSNTTLE